MEIANNCPVKLSYFNLTKKLLPSVYFGCSVSVVVFIGIPVFFVLSETSESKIFLSLNLAVIAIVGISYYNRTSLALNYCSVFWQ